MSRSVGDTHELAYATAHAIADSREGWLLLLTGELGTGKTEFVRGLVKGLGGEPDWVLSPTFVLQRQYPTTPRIVHIDLYRLENPERPEDLEIEDEIDGGSIVAVEWADKFKRLFNFHDPLEIQFAHRAGGQARMITLSGSRCAVIGTRLAAADEGLKFKYIGESS